SLSASISQTHERTPRSYKFRIRLLPQDPPPMHAIWVAFDLVIFFSTSFVVAVKPRSLRRSSLSKQKILPVGASWGSRQFRITTRGATAQNNKIPYATEESETITEVIHGKY